MSYVLQDVDHLLSDDLLEDVNEEWNNQYTLEGCLVDPGPPTPGTLGFLGNFDFWDDKESAKLAATPHLDDHNLGKFSNLNANGSPKPDHDTTSNNNDDTSIWTPDVLEATLKFYNLLDDNHQPSNNEINKGSGDYLDDVSDLGSSSLPLEGFCRTLTEYEEQYDDACDSEDERFEEETHASGKRPRAMRALWLEIQDRRGHTAPPTSPSAGEYSGSSPSNSPKIWAQQGQRGPRMKRKYTKVRDKVVVMRDSSNREILSNATDLLDAVLGRRIYLPTLNQPPPTLPSVVLQTPDSSKSPSPRMKKKYTKVRDKVVVMRDASNREILSNATDLLDAVLGRRIYLPTSNQPPPTLPSVVLQTPDSSESPSPNPGRFQEVTVPRRIGALRRARSNSHGQQVGDSRQTKRIKTPEPPSSPRLRSQPHVESRNTSPTPTLSRTEVTTYVNSVTEFPNTYIPDHKKGHASLHEAQDSDEYILDESDWTMYMDFAPDTVVGAMKTQGSLVGETNVNDAASGSEALQHPSMWGKGDENALEKRHKIYNQRSLCLRSMDINSSLPEWAVSLVPVNARLIETRNGTGESSMSVDSPLNPGNQYPDYQIEDATMNLCPHIDVQPLSPSSSEPFELLEHIIPSQGFDEVSQTTHPTSQINLKTTDRRKEQRLILKGKGIQKSEGVATLGTTTSNVRSNTSQPGDMCHCSTPCKECCTRHECDTKAYSIPPSPWQAAGFPPFTHKPVDTYFASQGRALPSAAILMQAMSYVDKPLPTNWASIVYPRVIGFSMKIFSEEQKLEAWSLINKPKVEGKFTCHYTPPKWTPTTYADDSTKAYKEYFPVIIERSTKKVMGFNYADYVNEMSLSNCTTMKGWIELFSMDWIQPSIFGRVIAANNGLIVIDSAREQNVMVEGYDNQVRRDQTEECSDDDTNRNTLSVINPLTHEFYFLPSIPSESYQDKVGHLRVSFPFERLYQLFVLGWVNKTKTLALATYNSANAKWVHFDAIEDAKMGIGGRTGCVMINYGLYYGGISIEPNQHDNRSTIEIPSIFYFNCSASRQQHLVSPFFVQVVSDLLRITDPPKVVLASEDKVYASARGVYADSTETEFGWIVLVDVLLNEDGTPNGQYARVNNGVMPLELMKQLFKFDKYPLQKPQPYEVVGNGNLIAFHVSDPDIVLYDVLKAEWSITCFHDIEPSGESENFIMVEGSYTPDWLAAT